MHDGSELEGASTKREGAAGGYLLRLRPRAGSVGDQFAARRTSTRYGRDGGGPACLLEAEATADLLFLRVGQMSLAEIWEKIAAEIVRIFRVIFYTQIPWQEVLVNGLWLVALVIALGLAYGLIALITNFLDRWLGITAFMQRHRIGFWKIYVGAVVILFAFVFLYDYYNKLP